MIAFVFALLSVLAVTLRAQSLPGPTTCGGNPGGGYLCGIGSTFAFDVYNDVILTYGKIRPTITPIYYDRNVAGGSGAGRSAIINNTLGYNWAGSDTPFVTSSTNTPAVQAAFDMRNYPIGISSVVVLVGLGYEPNGPLKTLKNTEPFILTREVLPLIWSLNITMWNDPRILLNQTTAVYNAMVNYNKTIQLILRVGSSGTTSAFTSALASMSPEWKATYGSSFDQWTVGNASAIYNAVPSNFRLDGNLIVSAAELFPDTIAYTAFDKQRNKQFAVAASLINPLNQLTGPLDINVPSLTFNASNFVVGSLIDVPDDQNYPILTTTYLVVTAIQQPNFICSQQKDLFFFIFYLFTNPLPTPGWVNIPTFIQNPIVSQLFQFFCDGRANLLSVTYASDPGGIAMIVVTGATQLFVILCVIITIIFHNHPYIKISGPVFNVISGLGALLMMCISYILLGRLQFYNCAIGVFFYGVGFTVFVSGYLMKEWRVYTLFLNSKRLKVSKVRLFDRRILVIGVGSFIIEIVLDILFVTVTQFDTTYGNCNPINPVIVSLYIFWKILLLFVTFIFIALNVKMIENYPEIIVGIALVCFCGIGMATLILIYQLAQPFAVVIAIGLGTATSVLFFYLITYGAKFFFLIRFPKAADAHKDLEGKIRLRNAGSRSRGESGSSTYSSNSRSFSVREKTSNPGSSTTGDA